MNTQPTPKEYAIAAYALEHRLPIALFVRAPILLTLHALIRLGEWAEEMEHRAGNIPGLRPAIPLALSN